MSESWNRLASCLVLPLERLSPSPSAQDGMSNETELDLRSLGCNLIQTAGKLLRLPQVAMATACVLYQRFFYSKSFIRYNFEHHAMGCLTLATKIEEAPRRPRDIINVFAHVKQVSFNKKIFYFFYQAYAWIIKLFNLPCL